MEDKEIEEKISKLESDVKSLNRKVFPPKIAQTRGDPLVILN